jgi:hypothetical protein
VSRSLGPARLRFHVRKRLSADMLKILAGEGCKTVQQTPWGAAELLYSAATQVGLQFKIEISEGSS